MADKKTIDKIYKIWEVRLNKVKAVLKQVKEMDFQNCDFDEATHLMVKFEKARQDMWQKAFLSELVDSEGRNLLQEILVREGYSVSDTDLNVLSLPEKRSYLQDLDLELLHLVDKSSEAQKKGLKKLTKEYYYIRTGWGRAFMLTEKDFQEMLGELSKKDLKEFDRLDNFAEVTLEEKKAVCDKCGFNPKLLNLFYFFSRLAEWRDIRKQYVQICNTHLYDYAKRVSKEWKIEVGLVVQALCSEIAQGKMDIKLLKQRKKLSISYGDENDISLIMVGPEAKKIKQRMFKCFNSQFSEVKGNTGNKGKCIGVVKIVRGENEFSKFKKGDILVAPMTRPEYMPLIGKAMAIVTDEGGLTCHAAIVSRELGIPCVIGTQVATSILKDGDEVEVDAEKGIVKKITGSKK
ncbi:MAG: hypothetical protein KKG59_06575 [Nanoarchaeota archaeon]|nr:hypothetical protein [Nanoarchaeota archaeon]